jgi:hypothetical protein
MLKLSKIVSLDESLLPFFPLPSPAQFVLPRKKSPLWTFSMR